MFSQAALAGRVRAFFKKPETAIIVGAFDRFAEDRFVCGWAQDEEGELRHVPIVVMLGEQVVAKGTTDQPRGDGLPGFKIDTEGKVTPMDVVDRRVRVFGEDPTGRRFGLPRHGPMLKQLMKRLFPPEKVEEVLF